jgi:uncharacterized protein (TIGR03382 family)
VLDAPATAGMARLTARPDGDACAVTVEPGGSVPAAPLVVALDEHCAVAADPPGGDRPAPAGPTHDRPAPDVVPSPPPPGAPRPRPARGGCCGTGATSGTPMAMSLLVLALRRRRR